jgi:hypothetical protein
MNCSEMDSSWISTGFGAAIAPADLELAIPDELFEDGQFDMFECQQNGMLFEPQLLLDLNDTAVITSYPPMDAKCPRPSSACSDTVTNTITPSFTPSSSYSAYPPFPTLSKEPEFTNNRAACDPIIGLLCSRSIIASDKEAYIDDAIDTTNKKYVQVEENDVLFGRGGYSNGHPGNKTYLGYVLQYQPAYKIVRDAKGRQH